MHKIINKVFIIMIIINMISPILLETTSIAYGELREKSNLIADEKQEDKVKNEKEDAEQQVQVDNMSQENEQTSEADSTLTENHADDEITEKSKQDVNNDLMEEENKTIIDNPKEESNKPEAISDTENIDGTYIIISALDGNKVVEVEDGKTENSANVRIWNNRNIFQQQFIFKYNQTKKTYTIKARHSSKVLDVAGAGKENGTNIWQYEDNGTDAQQWELEKTDDEYYYIKSKCNGLYLDIVGASTNNGTNIQMYEGNGTKAQKFKFEKVPELECEKIKEEGTYYISTALSDSKVIQVEGGKKDNSTNVNISDKTSKEYKKFKLQYNTKTKTYTIIASHSNKVMDVASAGKTNGANVWQYDSNGSSAQQWVLVDAGNEYYYIKSKCNGLYLDVVGASVSNGTNIQMYEGNGTKAQKFKFEKVPELECEEIKEEGTYYISTALSSSKVIQIDNGKIENSSNINISSKINKEYQKFKLKYDINSKTYTILANYSNKVMDVASAGLENGTNVWQYDSNGSSAQQWVLVDTGNGYYNIVSKCNGLYLDVAGGSINNGTNIQMYEGNGTNAQKFKFIPIDEEECSETVEDGIYYMFTKLEPSKMIQIDNSSNKLKISNFTNLSQGFEFIYLNNGYYNIKKCQTGKYLTVENGKHSNGSNIKEETKNNTTRQEWKIKIDENDYITLISRYSGLCIDVPAANVKTTNNLQMYESNGTSSQKFTLQKSKKIVDMQSDNILNDGIYKIYTGTNKSKALDISGGGYQDYANLQIWDKDKVQQQKFQITYNDTGKYYKIVAVHSGKAIDVQGNSKKNGANVHQYTSSETEAQQWILQDAGDGYYYIVAKGSLLYMDLTNGNTSNGANIQVYEGNGSNAQKFKIEKDTMLDNDIYNIAIKINSNKYFDIAYGSANEGADLQIWENSNVNQQRFKIEYIDDAYFKIIARHSNMALTEKNDIVIQSKDETLTTQLWSAEIAGNGYYKIRSKSSGKYLEVENNKNDNGTKIKLYDKKNSSSQQFMFLSLPQKRGIDVSTFNNFINWSEVRQSGQVDFAIIRAGFRGYENPRLVTDVQFERNIIGASSNGIPIGLYFYTQAITPAEAVEEANYVLDLIRRYNIKVTYPIAIDTESTAANARAEYLDVATRTAICNAFVNTIENAGYIGAIYASKNWFYNNLDVSQLNYGDIWVAHYTSEPQTNYQYRYHIWQYTSKGYVPGINGNVDMNISYKKY